MVEFQHQEIGHVLALSVLADHVPLALVADSPLALVVAIRLDQVVDNPLALVVDNPLAPVAVVHLLPTLGDKYLSLASIYQYPINS